MTHTEAGITHILRVSPRGFANEVSTIPVTHEYLRLAEEIEFHYGGETTGWAKLAEWSEASGEARQRIGILLRDLDADGLDSLLADSFLPAFSGDPDAYDLRDGQWVSREAA